MVSKVLFSSNTGEWSTPQDLFDILDHIYKFKLDPCASKSNHKTKKYYNKKQDGLSFDWCKDSPVFMNPPYGREIKLWVKYAYEQALKGCIVVCLLPSRTDTIWWHEYCMKGDITFIKGRLKFSGATNCAPFPSAIVVFK